MKKILFLLAFLINALLVFSQAPIPLNRLSRSSDRFMMMMSDTNRYASYQHFNYWLSKFADSLNLQNPYWLGSILPQQSVSIGAERHNFIISNGIIGSFATDTTANGWILQSYVSGLNADGVGKIGGRNYLTGKRYGIDFDGATPTILSGNVGLSLANDQVQDSTLNNAYRYVWTVPAGNALTGVGEYVREDSIEGVWLKPLMENEESIEIQTSRKLSFDDGVTYIGFEVELDDQASNIVVKDSENEQNSTGITKSDISIRQDTTFSISIGKYPSFEHPVMNFASGKAIIPEGDTLGALFFNQQQVGADVYAGIASITTEEINVLDTLKGTSINLFATKTGTQQLTTGFIFDGENITEPTYPDSRDDTGTAVNMLSTDGNGVQESHPLTETFGAIWLQSSTGVTNTGTQSQAVTGFSVDLNDDSNNYVVFGDTVVQISLTGCYTISMIAAVSSAAALNTDGWDVQMSYGGSVVPPNYVSNSPFIDLQPQYVNRSWTIKTTSSNVSVRPVFSTTIANGATTADISGVMWSIKRNY